MTAPPPPVSPSPASVRALLAALGDTPEAVAATLLAGGHRGDPGSACGCPVARYLAANGVEDAEVTGGVKWADSSVSLPRAVDRFINRFDGDDGDDDRDGRRDGEWPELRLPTESVGATP